MVLWQMVGRWRGKASICDGFLGQWRHQKGLIGTLLGVTQEFATFGAINKEEEEEEPPQGPIEDRYQLEELVDQLEVAQRRRYVEDWEYVQLLQACGTLRALAMGKRIHSQIVKAGLDNRVYLGNHLVHMYGKCGSLEDAWTTFEGLCYRNMYTWTAMIGACAQHHRFEAAMFWFRQMQLEGVKPDKVTFLAGITACETPGALSEGKVIHGYIAESGHESDNILGNALISMYTSCGSLEDARRTFNEMPVRNIITWTAMIAAYAKNSFHEAFQMFQHMQLEGLKSNYVTFITLIQACAEPEALGVGKLIHARSVECGVDAEILVRNALITMYGRCSSLEDAQMMFINMHKRDLVSWNSIITENAQHGHNEQVVQLYRQMQLEGFKPDKVTFLTLLSVYSGRETLQEGKTTHGHIIETGIPLDVALGTALLSMYSKCESLEDTCWMFENMPHRNVVSWNVMTTAYAQHGLREKTVQIMERMQLEGMRADNVTCVTGLNVCVNAADLELGKKINGWVVEGGFEADVILGNALLNMYSRCGGLEEAGMMFNKVPEQNVVTWTAMLAAFSQHNQHKEALLFFHKMQLDGLEPNSITFVETLSACVDPEALAEGKLVHACVNETGNEMDVVVGSALVAMYGRCGRPEDARRYFDTMVRRNMVTWSAMIAAYVQHGQDKEALKIFRQMQLDGFEVTPVTFVTILSGCANLAALDEGKKLHSYAVESKLEAEGTVGNALVTMYGKCGSLEDAREIFERTRRQDIISWNAMITAYAQHGHARVTLELFHRMQQESVKPDHITFVSLLSVCSHAGLLVEGVYCYAGIHDHGIEPRPDHYSCVIDLLGRAGKLQEAEDFIESLPVQPTAVAWMSLLGSCRSHGDVDRGKRTAERLIQLNPKSSAAHVVLSSIYASERMDAVADQADTTELEQRYADFVD